MASPSVETIPSVSISRDAAPARVLEARLDTRGMAAVLSPPVAALLALLANKLLPDGSGLVGAGLYPLLLEIFLLVTALLALAQWLWPRLRPGVRYYGPLLAGVPIWLCFWDLATAKFGWAPRYLFPAPDMVLGAIWEDRLILLDSAYESLKRLSAGYFAGVALGLSCGVLMGWFRDARYWGVPVMKVLGPIPATALVATAMVLFPDSFLPGPALIAFAVWFPVTMLTMSGIINVPASYFDVARTLGAGRTYLIFRVALPAAMPSMFIGLFMGLLSSFLVLVVAETVGVKNGLGWYLKWELGYGEYHKVGGVLVIMSVFFCSILTLLFKVRDRVLSWQKGVIRW